MFNPNTTPTVSPSDAIVRIDQCGVGTSVVFTDRAAMDSYVAHVEGVAARRYSLQAGGYLQGEVTEQDGFETVFIDGEYHKVPRMVTYPWLRLKPAN